MAEITREHLELAALAAGHTIYGWCTGPIPLIGEHEREMWRPHLDDGDAARLQVDLKISVRRSCDGWEAAVPHLLPALFSASCDLTMNGSRAAWREAIVLCAAAVGEKMKGGA